MSTVTGRVVHCKKETYDVYIGRTKDGIGLWGNPFVMKDGSETERERVCKEYREWVLQQPHLMNRLHLLRGKTLGCFCAPKACHGDTLNYLANDTVGTLRLIVAGSRGFRDYDLLRSAIDNIAKQYNDIIIIEGEAKGADLLGKRYAKEHGHTFIPMPAEWLDDEGNLDRAAGHRRNENMARIANAAIIFWDGLSPGSKSMIQLAKKYKLLTIVHIYPEDRFYYESDREEFRWD